MRRIIALSGIIFALQAALLVDTVAAQVRSRISVTVPRDDTELLMNDKPIASTGATLRNFESEPLEPGKEYDYSFVARWSPNNYTVITRSTTVHFRAGDGVIVDLTKEDPNDRARIRYVPTPDAVVAEMIAVARIGPNDVVFEPGCGDARITIAAVKAGAKRGVGVDIDQERVDESTLNVKAAGLADTIDIRLGDALDIKDFSDATVVFMYMGDEFGHLIKPILQRQLKVGTRIISHRFKLGDWTPDQTVTVEDLGIPYLLNVWTVTQEIKDRAEKQ
jgi:uncharacterized protein (TIGR03000 family)